MLAKTPDLSYNVTKYESMFMYIVDQYEETPKSGKERRTVMSEAGKRIRKRVAVFMTLCMMMSLVQGVCITAKATPKMPKNVFVELGDIKKVSIQPNGFKIKNVEAKLSNENASIMSLTKKLIVVNGVSVGNVKLVTTIKAKKKKKTKTFTMITSIRVKRMGDQGGDPTGEPSYTESPASSATPSATSTPSASQAPSASQTPAASQTPGASAKPSASPGTTSTPKPTSAPSSSGKELSVKVTCKTGLRYLFDADEPISQESLKGLVEKVEVSDPSGNSVGSDKIKRYEYSAFYDIDCTKPYKEGAELEAGTSYIRVKVIVADAYRDQYRDSAGVGTLVLEM